MIIAVTIQMQPIKKQFLDVQIWRLDTLDNPDAEGPKEQELPWNAWCHWSILLEWIIS